MAEETRQMVRCFDGTGDVSSWLKKATLVAKLKEIKRLECFYPLYLEGDAFAVYDQMDDADKEDASKIEQALRTAFEVDRYEAYDLLRSRRWTPGEPVDVFLTDLRRLAKLASVTDEEVIRGAFVVGLPREVSMQLRAAAESSTCKIANLCEQARILLSQHQQWKEGSNFAAVGRVDRHRQRQPERMLAPSQRHLKCYICDGAHLTKSCPSKVDSRTCWRCGETGHLARNCSAQPAGNDTGKSSAPAASQ